MPHFSLPDTSGLTPLEFPFGTSNPFRSFVTNLPQPAPEAVAHFQAAMAEPQAESDVSSTPKDDSTPITDVGRVNFIYDMPYTSLQEVAPDQPDAEITIERQDIGQPTTDRQVQQTTVSTPMQAPTVEALERTSAHLVGSRVPRDRPRAEHAPIPSLEIASVDVPTQTPTIDEPTQPPTVEALEGTSAHLVGSRVPRDRPRAEHAPIPGLEIASIDVPTQARTIDQPNLLPATDNPTVKRQDGIGGTIPIVTTSVEHVTTSVEHVTTKVEHVDTQPTVTARPEASPYQSDTKITIERQDIGQTTDDRLVRQTTIDMPTQAQTITQPNPLPATDDSTVVRQEVIDGTVRIVTTKVERVDTQPTVTARPEAAPYQAYAEITIERQDIGQTTDNRQVRQTTIDVPSQVQTIYAPAQVQAIDAPAQVQTIDVPTQTTGGTQPVATDAQQTTVVQPNPLPVTDTQPTVTARPEAAPYQADAEITIERQNIVQTTADKKVWQTVDDKQVLQAVNDMPPTLQAAPAVVPVAPDIAPTAVADIVSIEIDPAAATAKTRELVEAAAQVADTILVTPSLVRGDGEITIRLKPTVLDGSEIRMKAKGTEIAIIIAPATPSVAQIVEQAKVQFEQMLAERLPTFQIAVSIQPAKTTSKWKDSAA